MKTFFQMRMQNDDRRALAIAGMFALCILFFACLEFAGCKEVNPDPVTSVESNSTTDTVSVVDSISILLLRRENYYLDKKLKATTAENRIMGEHIKSLARERDSLSRVLSWNENFK